MKTILNLFLLLVLSYSLTQPVYAQKKDKKSKDTKEEVEKGPNLSTFNFRSIGPAMISGRIIDLAVNPAQPSEYYVAVASGGVWKTEDGGITFRPIFDGQKPYSIACVTIAPSNPHLVWVGSGENNSQRAVARGHGVYRSLDGGKSWKNMGLENSEHIGKIIIHPNNENVVFVAAQGPLWNAGGDRGLYKTTDGGENWEKVLEISENTGVSDILMDPRNPQVMYAASYQRRRHVFTLINGGPESAIYKSIDGGKNWRKLKNGLPSGDVGRIGLAISPANPDYIYAIIEAASGEGFYRSVNRGESWTKMSSYRSNSPQYYQELIPDPHDANMVYSMDTYSRYTADGGKSWTRISVKSRHVDDHALWIDPSDTKHLLIGGDGGLYESFNRGKTWDYKANLPLVQFYRVTVDEDFPFYNVYGGTQDNNSVYGPSRTKSHHGIVNSDWKITHGGDGFETAIDPKDKNTIYVQSQYGWLARYNRETGEEIDIKPMEPDNGEAYRWNWNAPLLVSAHNHKTLYFAANKVFKSTNRGQSWEIISPDLTRQINRNTLPVMGKIQSPEAVAKNASTSVFGNLVSMAESPVQQGLLYLGSDDGQISVSEDDGKTWEKYTRFPGVPDMTYVSCLIADKKDANVVYAAFDNHKKGDYKSYVLKSTDKGKTWTSIASNLPEDETVYSLAQDHIMPSLLFVGTEYGLWFTTDGGQKWRRLKSGLPSIAVRDIDIQRRENDLALATFGRGFYILDDYAALRTIDDVAQANKPHIFEVRDAWLFNPSHDWGWRKKGHFGDDFYTASNPPVVAVIKYYYNDSYTSLKQQRKKKEKEAAKNEQDIEYPSFEELAQEDNEIAPYLVFIIKDNQGNEIRKLKAPVSEGMAQIEWDMRYAGTYPINKGGNKHNFANEGNGAPVLPGEYTVEMYLASTEGMQDLNVSQKIRVKSLWKPEGGHQFNDPKFYQQAAQLIRKYDGLKYEINYLSDKTDKIILALKATPGSTPADLATAIKVRKQLDSLYVLIRGNSSLKKRNAAYPPSLDDRLSKLVWGVWSSSEGPTNTHKQDYEIVYKRGKEISAFITALKLNELKQLDEALDKIAAPYTPGRSSGF
jgi:photosystem II stability/assembly factor-like uncharacterized protein